MWELERKVSDYCVQTPPGVFTISELDEIIRLGAALTIEPALVGSPNGEINNHRVRKTQLGFFNTSQENEWIYRKLTDIIKNVNSSFFNYNIDAIETLQFSTYNVGDFYDTHIDSLPYTKWGMFRKISFSLQLNDPLEYTGGDLVVNSKVIGRQRGSITFFNSFVSHSVTPVQSGVRRALVGWIIGPKFV